MLSRVPWAIHRSLLMTYFIYSRFVYGVTFNTYLFTGLVLAVLGLHCDVGFSLVVVHWLSSYGLSCLEECVIFVL